MMTTILSPQSMWGVNDGLCLPRSRRASTEASRPSTSPSASTSSHFLSISEGLAEKVFIAPTKSAGVRIPGPGEAADVSDRPPQVKRRIVDQCQVLMNAKAR